MRSLRVVCAFAVLFSTIPSAIAQASRPTLRDSATPAAAGNPGAARQQGNQNRRVAADPNRIEVPDDLLEAWSRASSGIKKLQGSHLKRDYDDVFQTERLSEGLFYYEAPDKGRIDVKPVDITRKMLDERVNGDVPCRRKKQGQETGKPYDLLAGTPEKWVCDGHRVFMVDDEKKEALVQQVPAEMQGTGIMHSSLPFLFGMPPELARERFDLTLASRVERGAPSARIKAIPKTRIDQWSTAEIILDLKTFLPIHVRIVDSAQDENGREITSRETVYSFSDYKVNERVGLINKIFGAKDPFQLDLRGYNTSVVNPPAQQAQVPKLNPGQAVVPELKGFASDKAKQQLELLGFKVKFFRGGPAPAAADVYRVKNQDPEGNTALNKGETVSLLVYEEYKPAPQAAKRP